MRQDWERLGRLVVRARVERGYTTQEAFGNASGISVRTIRDLEAGRRVGRRTLALAEIALDWPPGSAYRILEGGEPTLSPEDRAVATALKDVDRAILEMTPEELVRTRRTLELTTKDREFADQWLLDALRQREEAARRAQKGRDVS